MRLIGLMHWQMFEENLWRKMSSRPECKYLNSSLLFLEIFSYIKGSSEAVKTKEGHLSASGYEEVISILESVAR